MKPLGKVLIVAGYWTSVGDGWHSQQLADQYGLNMLAYEPKFDICDDPSVIRTGGGINYITTLGDKYVESCGAGICIAVLAHISDVELIDAIVRIARTLRSGSLIAVFETTGAKKTVGKTWTRRTVAEYLSIFSTNGFIFENMRSYRNQSFTWMLKHILDPIRWRFFKGDAMSAYSHPLNQSISGLLFAVSLLVEPLLLQHIITGDANTLFFFRRI